MTELHVYGEDVLTLWGLENKFDAIAGVKHDPARHTIFYRPSFGRKGGADRSEFGEFDFAIILEEKIILGESKWDKSSEVKKNEREIELAENQVERHRIMSIYIKEAQSLIENDNKSIAENWEKFKGQVKEKLNGKPVPDKNTALAQNLIYFLDKCVDKNAKRCVKNLVWLFYNKEEIKADKVKGTEIKFDLVKTDYAGALEENSLMLKINLAAKQEFHVGR